MTFGRLPLRRVVLDACDGPFGSSLKSEHYGDSGARVVRLRNIGNGAWNDADAAFLPLDYWATLWRHHAVAGDLIMAGLGDENHPLGRACVLPELGPSLVKADCYRLRLDPDRADPRFLAFFLSSAAGAAEALRLADGSTRARLTLGKALTIPVPDVALRDQRAIADYLVAQAARMDDVLRLRRDQLDLLDERRVEATRAVFAHATGVDRLPWLPSVDAEWAIVHLRWLVSCLDGGRIPVNREERAFIMGDIPYWGANGIVDRVDRALFDEPLVLLGEDGAPFFDRLKSKAFFVDGPIWPNNHIHVLRAIRIRAQFLTIYLNLVDYSDFVEGSTRDKLTQDNMGAIPVPVPPMAEQLRIEGAVSAIHRTAEARRALLVRQINLLLERREALITAAVTGQLEIPGVAA